MKKKVALSVSLMSLAITGCFDSSPKTASLQATDAQMNAQILKFTSDSDLSVEVGYVTSEQMGEIVKYSELSDLVSTSKPVKAPIDIEELSALKLGSKYVPQAEAYNAKIVEADAAWQQEVENLTAEYETEIKPLKSEITALEVVKQQYNEYLKPTNDAYENGIHNEKSASQEVVASNNAMRDILNTFILNQEIAIRQYPVGSSLPFVLISKPARKNSCDSRYSVTITLQEVKGDNGKECRNLVFNRQFVRTIKDEDKFIALREKLKPLATKHYVLEAAQKAAHSERKRLKKLLRDKTIVANNKFPKVQSADKKIRQIERQIKGKQNYLRNQSASWHENTFISNVTRDSLRAFSNAIKYDAEKAIQDIIKSIEFKTTKLENIASEFPIEHSDNDWGVITLTDKTGKLGKSTLIADLRTDLSDRTEEGPLKLNPERMSRSDLHLALMRQASHLNN